MQPWKMFVRSLSVVTVLTAGGFAAGQGVVPFSNASRLTAPRTVTDDTATDAPSVDPAATPEVTDDGTTTTTTTTEAPKPDAPKPDAGDEPAPTKPPVVEVPDPAPTTDAPKVTAAPPAAPVEDAPADPAKPADKPAKVKGDHNCDGHPDNGWLKHTPPNKTYPDCDAAAGQVPPTAPQDKGRPATAPGHVKHGR